jgi:3',5'-cyclic AMP phosphodiesterase CpdA
MRKRTLAHVSDLHLGRSSDLERRARRLAEALIEERVDHVVVTGDITHTGRRNELAQFHRAFAQLIELGRVTVIPGNHDRLTDDLGIELMGSCDRVAVEQRDLQGLYLVRVDSTGAHNTRFMMNGHGDLCEEVLKEVVMALDRAPRNLMPCVLLHHHPLPLPEEGFAEKLSSWIGWPNALELQRGRELMDAIRGKCALVLHGHRHIPRAFELFGEDPRPLQVYNAGSSTELGKVRLFRHAGAQLAGAPDWLEIPMGDQERGRGGAVSVPSLRTGLLGV